MQRRTFLRLAAYGLATALTGSYTVFIERNIVLVNKYRIPLKDLPPSFHGFTIAQLTDLHLGFLVSPAFIEGVVAKTNALRPDAIVCTGDYVHERETKKEIEQVWPLLAKLHARYGVFSVLGNHDHWADTERSLYWLERSGQNLRHQCKAITKGKERIVLGGAGDYWQDQLKIDHAFASSDEQDCRILLAHNPDSVDTHFTTPVSLVLSGHTHGGQVVLPFFGPPVLPVHNKKYSSGLIRTDKTQLFISRGIGWTMYPVRFNCYPEIALLELVHPDLLA
jgi:predicted MPP superfamily phosphohydrolase